jgi:O-antigen ligase
VPLENVRSGIRGRLRTLLWNLRIDRAALALALCSVPFGIAITESFLFLAFAARLARIVQRRAAVSFPQTFWFWLIWAGLEILSWCFSPDLRAGRGEMRHLFLLAVVFLTLPALDEIRYQAAVWRGMFVAATISSTFLVGKFLFRLVHYSREISASPDPSAYLRTGGLIDHWMIYGTIEIVVFAGLLGFWDLFPEKRKTWLPAYALNGLAIALSMTRMLWVCSILLLGIDLAWRRSKWVWIVPVLPLAFFFVAPGVLRTRISESFRPDYYSNAERIQMLRVGWKMVKDSPLTGVGPGRVEGLYRDYLSPSEPVPAYYGHLHNNVVELAAEFGLPVVTAALTFVVGLWIELYKRWKAADDRETRFLCRTSILGLVGFLTAGLFDYTYGHSLGLILVSFAVLTPLLTASSPSRNEAPAITNNTKRS